MLDRPETQQILTKLLIIAAVGLLVGPLMDISIEKGDFESETVALLLAIKEPVEYFIGLFLWFQVIVLILMYYWGKDALSTSLQTNAMMITIGAAISKIGVDNLQKFNDDLAPYVPIIPPAGMLLMLFGFIALFYSIIKYLWVKV